MQIQIHSKLKQVTLKLLRDRPASKTLKDVADESGLTESWIKSFHLRGDQYSASVDKVSALYEHLSGKTLV